MKSAESFEDLICWQRAYGLKQRIRLEVMPCLPTKEQFELKSQILRAARSATANIAEGWGRYHFLDSNRFYYNSRGSLAEIIDHLLEARDEGYISVNLCDELRSETLEVIKVLNGFIFYLKRVNANSKR